MDENVKQKVNSLLSNLEQNISQLKDVLNNDSLLEQISQNKLEKIDHSMSHNTMDFIAEKISNNMKNHINSEYQNIKTEISKISKDNKNIRKDLKSMQSLKFNSLESIIANKSIARDDLNSDEDEDEDDVENESDVDSLSQIDTIGKSSRQNLRRLLLSKRNSVLKEHNKNNNTGQKNLLNPNIPNMTRNILLNLEKSQAEKVFNKSFLNKKEKGKIDTLEFNFDNQGQIMLFNKQETMKNLIKVKNITFQISDESNFTYAWNILILSVMIFHILLFPFEIFSEPWMNTELFQVVINVVFEWIFLVDIVLNFLTVYKDKYGHSVKDLSMIAINYINTWFIMDLIASLPTNNLIYFEFIETDLNNVQFRAFKFPKYLKMFRAWVNIFSSRIANSINFENISSFTTSQFNIYMNTIKYAAYFCLISNTLVCYNISFTYQCNDLSKCSNWFFYLMQSQFSYSLANLNDPYYLTASSILESAADQSEAEVLFYNQAWTNRTLLYLNSWQFILQTVTTVGYGDVGTDSTDERIFRCLCMIIGVILFTLLSTSVLETTITDTLNIYRSKEHEAMIEKLEIKYEIKGDSKRFLNLLGDSVQTEPLSKELKFAKLLPRQMCDKVLTHIWGVYKAKLPLLNEESIQFFVEVLRESKFRRCVFDEFVELVTRKVYMIQSGQIGCYINHSRMQLQNEQLYQIDVGGEIGYHSQLEQPKSSCNYIQSCTTNSELIEISSDKLYPLIMASVRGLDYILIKLEEFFVDLQMIVALYQSMLSNGLQIDTNWQQKTIVGLQLNSKDQKVLHGLCNIFSQAIDQEEYIDETRVQGKWQMGLVSSEIVKQVKQRSRELTIRKISDKQPDLINAAKRFVTKKVKKVTKRGDLYN